MARIAAQSAPVSVSYVTLVTQILGAPLVIDATVRSASRVKDAEATGLSPALTELGVSPLHTVGVGDAENDQAFLTLCGLSAAVANALPAVKQEVDLVMAGEQGAGVVELIDRLLTGRLDDVVPVHQSSRG